MKNNKFRIYLKNIIINVIIAYFIIHPYSMIVFKHFENGAASPLVISIHGTEMGKTPAPDANMEILQHFFHSFSFEMLPMSLSYVILGAIIGFVLSKREYEIVEEKYKVETEKNKVKEINKELERVNKMKDDFLAVCSHDLKAPLCGAYLCLQFIQAKVVLDELQKKYIDTGIQHLMVMEKFIHELLHISKLESGKEILHLDKIDVNGFIKELTDGMKDYAVSQKIELTSNKLDEKIIFTADRLKLIRIFNNLISNAIKFANKAVITEVRAEANTLIFAVSDDGPGIPIEDQEKIFNKFEQAKSKKLLSLKNQGTGLGLAIVKKLVELHNGTVAVTSDAGSGAVFTVVLPRI